jgi:hypothetical protein
MASSVGLTAAEEAMLQAGSGRTSVTYFNRVTYCCFAHCSATVQQSRMRVAESFFQHVSWCCSPGGDAASRMRQDKCGLLQHVVAGQVWVTSACCGRTSAGYFSMLWQDKCGLLQHVVAGCGRTSVGYFSMLWQDAAGQVWVTSACCGRMWQDKCGLLQHVVAWQARPLS